MTDIKKAQAILLKEGFFSLGSSWKTKGINLFLLTSLAVHVALGSLLLMCPKMQSEAQVYELELVQQAPSVFHPVAQKPRFKKVITNKQAALEPEKSTFNPAPIQDSTPEVSGEADEAVFTLNQLTQPPRLLKEVKAVFPPQARAELKEGHVVFDVIVQPDGKPSFIRKIESSAAIFEEAAQKAVEQALFRPGIKDGKEVAARIQYRVRFQLR